MPKKNAATHGDYAVRTNLTLRSSVKDSLQRIGLELGESVSSLISDALAEPEQLTIRCSNCNMAIGWAGIYIKAEVFTGHGNEANTIKCHHCGHEIEL